ncbi:hypothetical protein IT6_08280 [Methylacidiphilum caldifontis]|nr:hypothetical protein [Methylacidiphilum caldifontis]QSR88366.1 hypothetical protein IT6_08280 [Methylacidiphilum caldifontis]
MKSQDSVEMELLKKRIKEHLEQNVEKYVSADYFEHLHKSLHRRLRVEMIKNKTFLEIVFEKMQGLFDSERMVVFRVVFAGIFLFVSFLTIMDIGFSNRSSNLSSSLSTKYLLTTHRSEEPKQPSQTLSPSSPSLVPPKQSLEVESTKLSPGLSDSQDPQSFIHDSLTHYEAMVAF